MSPDLASPSRRVVARVACVLAAFFGIFFAPAPLAAGSGSSTLAISVTVTRSCAIDTQVVNGSSPAIRLECARGAAHAVLVGPAIALPSRGVQTITVPVQAPASTTGVQVVTVNF